jgi:hypothetical protein
MCGLAGYAGIADNAIRQTLTLALGLSIDARGGHAAGYVTISKRGRIHHNREIGPWELASPKFWQSATAGSRLAMFHSRFATSGSPIIEDNAHPFPIERDGKVRLYGAHNGVLWGATESAHKHGRSFSVDSREFFELLADGELSGIKDLEGYGAVTWIDPSQPDRVKLCKISITGDLELAQLADGQGWVWGSTRDIVKRSCKVSGLKVRSWAKLKPFVIYSVYPDRVPTKNVKTKLSVSAWTTSSYSNRPYGTGSTYRIPAGGWGAYDEEDESDPCERDYRYRSQYRWNNETRAYEFISSTSYDPPPSSELEALRSGSEVIDAYCESDGTSADDELSDLLERYRDPWEAEERAYERKLRSWAESDGYSKTRVG